MIYIAGKFSAQARLREERTRLRRLGFAVNSSWLDEGWASDGAAPVDVLRGNALRDLDEVRDATTLIIDTLDESPTGGREVELGVAMAMGKNLFRIGPERNIFHYVVPSTFESWEGLYAHLEELS